MNNSFGERLRAARRDASMSQTDLERRTGIPKARLSRYENDHVLPSITSLSRISRALGIAESDLIGEQTDPWAGFVKRLQTAGVILSDPHDGMLFADEILASRSARRRGAVVAQEVATGESSRSS